ncbi:MAG TPA: hypothetical protein VGF48_15070 [Thermoanaerobaculia bacterium]
MCLLAATIESAGIATVAIVLLRNVAQAVRPPRALCVPYPFGYPLGKPHDPEIQREVMMQAFALLESEGPPPVIV